MELSTHPPSHSAEYLREHRDFWWNADFLELMAKRWDLRHVKSILDVGCGIGHWGQCLEPFLPKDAVVTGIDREEEWIEKAQQKTRSLKKRFNYQVSKAEKIPFPDNSFDMVTCQTLLLHVHDVMKVLKEMVRVLKPGGLLAVVEPNNSITEIVFDTVSYKESAADSTRAVQFHMNCERGQQKLGHGFSSIGDLLPAYFHKLKLDPISIYLSDKTTPLIPPYDTPEQQAFIRLLKEWYEGEYFVWDKEESKKYFLANGGTEAKFAEEWSFIKDRCGQRIAAIEANTYATSGGCLLYLISGRKTT